MMTQLKFPIFLRALAISACLALPAISSADEQNLSPLIANSDTRGVCSKLLQFTQDILRYPFDYSEINEKKAEMADIFERFAGEVRSRGDERVMGELTRIEASLNAAMKLRSTSSLKKAWDSLTIPMIRVIQRINRQNETAHEIQRNVRPTDEQAWNTFAKLTDGCSVYVPNLCQSNVVRVFEEMKKRLPTLEARHFNVIILSRKDGWKIVPSSRPVKWDYHVFLSYGDLVLDPDVPSTWRSPQTMAQYIQNEFGQTAPVISATVVNGDQYLSWKTSITDLGVFRMAILGQYQAQSLQSLGIKN